MADSRDYSSALKRAFKCKNVNIERIKLLIKKSKELYSEILNDAVKSTECNLEVIKLLLDKGAELGNWILYDALSSKACTLEIIKLLLEWGAKLYRSVLEDAVLSEICNCELIKLLMDKGANFHPVILSLAIKSEKCDSHTLKFLLDCGAPVTCKSILCAISSEKCSVKFIKQLLERSEKSLHQKFGVDYIFLPLLFKRCDKIDVVQLFMEYGQKLNGNHLYIVMGECGRQIKFLKYILEKGMIIEKHIFKRYVIVSSNFNASKILLQFYFVRYFKTRLYEMNNTLNPENIFETSNFANETLYQEMCDFFSSLLKEFIKMTEDKIDHNLTLFSFVSNKNSSACVEHKIQYSYANEILSRLYSKEYVYSCDILCSCLSKYDVIKTLFELDIFVKKDEKFNGNKVRLNYDSLTYLVSYLSRDDIINLIVAYWHRDDDKNIMKNLKRSCILVEEQGESSLCVKRHKRY